MHGGYNCRRSLSYLKPTHSYKALLTMPLTGEETSSSHYERQVKCLEVDKLYRQFAMGSQNYLSYFGYDFFTYHFSIKI